MRNYPANSPQAAARIVALTMLADGYLSKAELDAMERHGGYRLLGPFGAVTPYGALQAQSFFTIFFGQVVISIGPGRVTQCPQSIGNENM